MILLENITKTYDGKTLALENIYLRLSAGKMMCLLGHNGAGKSTLLKILATILSPSSGEIYYNDIRYSDADKSQLKLIKTSIGFLGETTYLFGKLTPWEYLFYMGLLYGIKDEQYLKERIRYLISLFRIESGELKLTETYSSGLKKRIALAGVFINKPKLLLLDEPTNNLDPVGIKILKESLIEIKDEGASILLATHQLEIAENLSDIITIIDHGKIICSESIEMIGKKVELIEGEKSLENLYEILTEKL